VTRLVILVFVLSSGAVAIVEAVPRNDIVTLRNGDRITCEVRTLRRGLLEARTDDLGTIQIEWDKIASITTIGVFQVETVLGARHYGALGLSDIGYVAVLTSTGAVRLDMTDVVRLAHIDEGLWRRLDGSVSAGGSYTKSSGVGQFSLSGDVQVRQPAFEWRAAFDGTRTVQKSEPDSGRYSGQFTYTRLLRNRWGLPVFGLVESNRDLGYSLRSTVGGGIGRNVVQTNRTLLQVAGGLSVNREVPVDAGSVTNVDGLTTVRYSFFTYDFPKTEVLLQGKLFPSLSNLGRVRMSADSKLTRAIVTNDLYLAVTMFDEYDSRPPTGTAKSNDVGLTFSLGWKF
jgi:hypothetical protein